MDVDSLAASRIVGQSPNSAVDQPKPMWRTVRCLFPTFAGFDGRRGYPDSGEHHRLATGEAAS
ncbi:hypothetical protein [Halolamina pelagica]|uniref:hypothetical protein n=1 Tax=Halolamina pelagica TaxID=699431 RepID=UPI0011873AFD|nr:hypothetical protein [Halolamina pelagica]